MSLVRTIFPYVIHSVYIHFHPFLLLSRHPPMIESGSQGPATRAALTIRVPAQATIIKAAATATAATATDVKVACSFSFSASDLNGMYRYSNILAFPSPFVKPPTPVCACVNMMT